MDFFGGSMVVGGVPQTHTYICDSAYDLGLYSSHLILSFFAPIFYIVDFLFLYLWFFPSSVFHINLCILIFLLPILIFLYHENYCCLEKYLERQINC